MKHENYMTMHSGRRVYFMNPESDDIWADDIAHALSLVCRFGGHVDRFYSVAQHCLIVAELLSKRGESHANQLAGLLHDASEAYLGDVISPVKQFAPEFKKMESKFEALIYRRYGLELDFVPDVVKIADRDVLIAEARSLFTVDAFQSGFSYLGEPSDTDVFEVFGDFKRDIENYTVGAVKRAYLEKLGDLWRRVNQ